jgi:hypothetical protein
MTWNEELGEVAPARRWCSPRGVRDAVLAFAQGRAAGDGSGDRRAAARAERARAAAAPTRVRRPRPAWIVVILAIAAVYPSRGVASGTMTRQRRSTGRKEEARPAEAGLRRVREAVQTGGRSPPEGPGPFVTSNSTFWPSRGGTLRLDGGVGRRRRLCHPG